MQSMMLVRKSSDWCGPWEKLFKNSVQIKSFSNYIYLTGNKIAELLRKAVKSVRPDTTSEELKRYSAHSLRVWACVLLDEAGKPPDYIKKRLCWCGDSFRMYLRDTLAIQLQHVDAFREAS
jgi:hypothetical protein